MAMRYFNWKLAIVLFVALVVFAGAAMALHRWQISTRADKALPLAEKAYENHDWEEAAIQFGKYIARNADDIEALLKYADAQLNRRPMISTNIQQAIAAYRAVLRLERDNAKAAERLTEIYLWPGALNAPGEAELIARRYLERHDDVALRRMLADALWRQRRFDEAADELTNAIEQHPTEVLTYELLGTMADSHPEVVDKPAAFWFDEAITRNPYSALAYIARAAYHLRHNDRDSMMADLDRAIELNPADTETRLRLIQELLNANAREKAREHLELLQTKAPAEEQLWRAWAELALRDGLPEEMYKVAETGLKELAAQPWDFMPIATELYIRSGHMEKAQDCISQMQSTEQLPYATAFLVGLLAERQGRLREAVAEWQKAVALGYRTPTIYMLLASTLTRLGDTQSAVGQLRVLLAENPNYLQGHLALTRLLAQTRNWPDTLRQARKVQQLVPGYPEAILLELQAQTYLLAAGAASPAAQEDAWRQIEARLAKFEESGNDTLAVRLLQVQVALGQGRLAEAATLLRELQKKHPSDLRLMMLHAELCVAEGKMDEAKTRYEDAVKQFPQSFDPIRSYALLLDRLNDRAGCEALIKDAFTRFEEPRIRRDAGLLTAEFYRRWQQSDKLLSWLTDLVVQFPSDVQPKRLLLTCDPILQDTRKAQEIIDEIRSIEGEKGWQWRYEQARLWISEETLRKELEDRGGRYVQIVTLLQENLMANPADQSSRLLLADVYERAGDLPLALTAYREALSRSPDSVPILVRAVAALHRAGEFDEARRILETADQRDLEHPDLRRLHLQSDLRRGDLASASDILETFIEQDPNDASANLSLAWIFIQQNKFDAAADILKDLKAKSPDSPSVIAAEVQLQMQQGNDEEAIRLCDEAVARLGSGPAYLLRAKAYSTLQQNDKALKDYSQAIVVEPDQAYTWANRAEFHHTLGRTDEAVADIRKAIALSPDSLPVQRLAISLFIVSGRLSLLGEAEELLDKAIEAVAGDPQSMEYARLRLLRARSLLLRGTGPGIEEARRILREAGDTHPKYAEAWEWMVRLELDQREPGRALDMAVRGLAHNPESRQLLMLKALAEKERSPSLAALTLKGLLEQYPGDIEILVELADTYTRADRPGQAVDLLEARKSSFEGSLRRRCDTALAAALYTSGQKEQAKSLFDTLIQAEPNDPMPVVALAQLLRRDRRWTELNQHVSRWRRRHPNDVNTSAAFASILVGTGDKEAVQMAEDLLRMTLRQNPDSMTCLIFLGMLMQDVGRYAESEKLNRKILKMDPNNVTAMNNLAWVLCENQQRYEEAFTLAERGLKMVPEYMDLIDTRGVIYYRRGEFEKAMADFVKCIELYPTNSPAAVAPHFHLARVYAALKRRTQAIEQLQEAMTMNKASLEQARVYVDSGRKTQAAKLLKDALHLQEEMEQLIDALNLQETVWGLSSRDVAEARFLLDQLQKGS